MNDLLAKCEESDLHIYDLKCEYGPVIEDVYKNYSDFIGVKFIYHDPYHTHYVMKDANVVSIGTLDMVENFILRFTDDA